MYFIVVDILLKHGCKDSRLGKGVMCNVVALLQLFLFNAEIFLKSWNDVHVCSHLLWQIVATTDSATVYIKREGFFLYISLTTQNMGFTIGFYFLFNILLGFLIPYSCACEV